jgi:hypothetical protein
VPAQQRHRSNWHLLLSASRQLVFAWIGALHCSPARLGEMTLPAATDDSVDCVRSMGIDRVVSTLPFRFVVVVVGRAWMGF